MVLATRSALVSSLMASFALAACGGRAERNAESTVVDSSGVRISEWHAGPEAFPLLRVSARFDSFLDDTTLRYFGSISDVQVAPGTGRVFVLDGLNARVSAFSPDGVFLAAWGRRGRGPGEFDGPVSLAVERDTVAVVDSRGAHFFTWRGTYLGSVGAPTRSDALGYLIRVYPTQLAWFATVAVLTPGGVGGRVELHRIDLAPFTTTFVRELFAYGQDARVVEGYVVGPLLSSQPAVTLDEQATVFIARGSGYEIVKQSTAGDLEGILRVDTTPVPVTQQLIDEYVARERRRCEESYAGASGCPLTKVIVPAVLQLPIPTHRPTIRSLVTGPGGALMIERGDLDPHPFARGDSTTFDLLSSDGVLRARFRAPPGLHPMHINRGSGWGYQVDELGVAALVRFSLR
jgi:hypothetical protein